MEIRWQVLFVGLTFVSVGHAENAKPVVDQLFATTTYLGSENNDLDLSIPRFAYSSYSESNPSATPENADGDLQLADLAIKTWQLVEADKPTVNATATYASALPIAAEANWQNLSGWQPERKIHFKTEIKSSIYHKTMLTFEYDVRMIYGGTVNGKGLYIASASVVPTLINALWGYHLDVKVNVASIYNARTADNPVGAIQLDVIYTYSTVLANKTLSNAYLLRGDGLMQDRDSGQVFFR